MWLLDVCRRSLENNYQDIVASIWFNPMSPSTDLINQLVPFIVAWYFQPWSFRENFHTKNWPLDPGSVENVFLFFQLGNPPDQGNPLGLCFLFAVLSLESALHGSFWAFLIEIFVFLMIQVCALRALGLKLWYFAGNVVRMDFWYWTFVRFPPVLSAGLLYTISSCSSPCSHFDHVILLRSFKNPLRRCPWLEC